jgi:hypothetical protein
MSKSTLPEGEGAGTMAPLPVKTGGTQLRSKLHQAYESYVSFCRRLAIEPMTIREWWYLLQQIPYRSRH